MNKKVFCLLLATVLSGITLAGCGKTGNSEVSSSSSTISEASSATSEASSEIIKEDPEPSVYVNTISDAAKEHAKTFPAVDGELPEWKGTHIVDKAEFAWPWIGFVPSPEDVRDTRMTVYKEDEVKEIAAAGFNFVRIHLDTRFFFTEEKENNLENAGLEFVGDIETINLMQYENLDRLIEWCIMNDIHICLDVISTPGGYMIGGDEEASREGLFTPGSVDQAIFIKFWEYVSKRYKDIDTKALSFNLYNEPPFFVTDNEALYVDLMNAAIDKIQEQTPSRLIFIDMLDYSVLGMKKINELHANNMVLAFHLYADQMNDPEAKSVDVQECISHAKKRLESYEDYAKSQGRRWMLQEFGAMNNIPSDQACRFIEYIVDYCNEHRVSYVQYAFNTANFALCSWEPDTDTFIYPGGTYEKTAYDHRINTDMLAILVKKRAS